MIKFSSLSQGLNPRTLYNSAQPPHISQADELRHLAGLPLPRAVLKLRHQWSESWPKIMHRLFDDKLSGPWQTF